jgi:two-component system chemotaxis response regulator CheB/chemosensory pili system protein ChpB (putative protein-glutamate methylesterase)
VPDTNVAIALLYEEQELGRHLRDALRSLGTPIVYEAAPASLDLAALENSGARVVIVNLDPEVEEHLDDVYGLLDDDRYSVVFNDAQASSSLSGWDAARWARHLASKILADADIDPPRPEGAEAVPAPAPVAPHIFAEDDGDEEIELASIMGPVDDEKTAISAHVGAEPRVEDALPIAASAASPQQALESRYDEMHLPADAGFPAAPPPAADEAFDFSTLLPDAPPKTEASAAPSLADALFSELESATPAKPAAASPEAFSLDLADDIASSAAAPAVPAPDDNDFDFADLDRLFDDVPASPLEAKPIESQPADVASVDVGDLGDFGTIEAIELDDSLPETVRRAGKSASPEFSLVDEDFSFDAPPPPPLAGEAPATPEPSLKLAAAADWTLEDMLEGDDAPSPPPPARPAEKPADFGIEKLSPEEYLAPATEETAGAAVPAADFSLDDFSLELMPIEEAVAPQPVQQREVHETWLNPDAVKAPAKIRRVWVLGASIGGPEAVRDFLRELPRDYPALFLLAQHMGAEFVDLMAQQLAKATPMTVRTPTHGERVGHGEVVIVPTTHRLQVDAEGIVTLEKTASDGAYSPSIDQVLRDVADRYGSSASAIIFSGMTNDAIEGAKYLASKGGTIYAQHPDSCVVSSMIDGIMDAGIVQFLGAPRELAEQVLAESAKAKR